MVHRFGFEKVFSRVVGLLRDGDALLQVQSVLLAGRKSGLKAQGHLRLCDLSITLNPLKHIC